MAQNETISSSLEDYLEAIAEIIEENGHAHAKDIAERLNVTMPSVTNALQALSSRGLADYQPHAPVVLTVSGAERAAVIRRRHEALRTFCAEVLKFGYEEADRLACRIEHVIGETAMARIVALSEAINSREECIALRDYLESTMPKIRIDTDEQLVSLDELPAGKNGVVVHVAETLRGVKKFADLGIVPGSLLQYEGRAPFGDLLRVRLMGSILSLRKSDAAHIWLKLAD